MKLKELIAVDFGSYRYLEFDYRNLGLALVHGATGSGKSTLADAAMWGMFGETAKDGASDDVRSWGRKTPTVVKLIVDDTHITRIRGTSKENDLYWTVGGDENHKFRGKDISETQKLLNQRLGMDADTYTACAYFHEFSHTANFFVAKAKDRRALFDKLADLAFPKKIADRTADKKKETKVTLGKKENEYSRLTGKIEQLTNSRESTSARIFTWKKEQAEAIKRMEKQAETFEEDKEARMTARNAEIIQDNLRKSNEIEDLHSKLDFNTNSLNAMTRPIDTGMPACKECGQPVIDPQVVSIRKNAQERWDKLQYARAALLLALEKAAKFKPQPLLVVDNSVNPYTAQLQIERSRPNPYTSVLRDLDNQIKHAQEDSTNLEFAIITLNEHHELLSRLYDLSYRLRTELLKSAISALQRHTNELLYKYFDAELTVNFSLESLDSVDVTLSKNGNPCSYKQLSRGQRSLLRLCFVVAVQEAASNATGVKFDTLFYDEILDGLSTPLKEKAFKLFEAQALNHSSVLLIDHDQNFQNMFDNKFEVILTNNESEVISD